MELYNDDCFNIFPKIADKTIDLFVLDLPYANKDFGKCTACKWDNTIDLDKMWVEIKRIMKPNAVILFYCNTKFGFSLIKSNMKWFRYDLIWKKSRKVGFLSANKMPLRQHENIYLFSDNHITYCKNGKYGTYNPQKTEGQPYKVKGGKSKKVDGSLSRGHEVISKEYENKGDRHPTSIIEHENIYVFSDADDDLENKKNKELRSYAEKVKKYIGKSLKIIDKKIGNEGIHGLYNFKNTQFGIPIEKNYNKLIEIYKINEMEGFIDYKTLKSKWDDEMVNTYNPQKTEGKPYTCKEGIKNKDDLYSIKNDDRKITINKGDRHPTSIIEHENIYIFSDYMDHNTEINNKHIIDYSKQILKYIGKTKAEIKRNIKDADHFFRYSKDNFSMATEETYNKLIAFYKINEMEGFIDYKTLKSKWDNENQTTYNPQKTEGKPYKMKEGGDINNNIYGNFKRRGNNKGDRHPTSIIDHENIYVFSDADDDLENKKNKELREYAEQVKKFINKPIKEINKEIGNMGIVHFYCFKSSQFGIPTQKNYNKLIELYNINEMENFIDYELLKTIWDNENETTYNPQKTEGKPYKNGEDKNPNNVYGITKEKGTITKTDRHPTSIYPETIETTILQHNNPKKSLHRTQKPLSLCEWLIKTYSNEGDVVMDFTMGSGTTGEACINTKRKFIGVELDKEIFKIAENRLNK